MSRIIAAYDLDEDHGRLWVNADLKRMPEVVIVANQPMDRAQTVTYVPETRLLEAVDAAREAEHRADMAERVAADHKGLCDSLKETNDDLRRIVDELRETERPADENDKLRELLRQALACIRQGEDEYGSDWSCVGCELCDTCDGLIQMRATAQELGVTDA